MSMCAYQGVRNGSFAENFAYVLTRWFLKKSAEANGDVLMVYNIWIAKVHLGPHLIYIIEISSKISKLLKPAQ